MFTKDCIEEIKQYSFLIENNILLIAKRWSHNDDIKYILEEKEIDLEEFTNIYASGVIAYFVGILHEEHRIGNCPIMHKMLQTFAEHHITSQEIFLICARFKRELINFAFEQEFASQKLVDNINCILDSNFSGVIKIYDDIITNQLLQMKYQQKKFSEYNEAIDTNFIVSKTNLSGEITYVNKAFVEISGYRADELLGHSHNIVKHPDTPTKLYEDLWHTILNKKIWHGIIKNKNKEGQSYYVEATMIPLLNENDEIVEFLSLRHEITDLILATQKAQAAELAKGQFLANMSHELRTPLNAILGFSQIIIAKKDTPEQVKNLVNKINIAGKNLLNLVNTILDFSKIEAGKMEYTLDNFEFIPIFEELKILTEPQAHSKNVSVVFPEISQDIFYGDKNLLKQTFMNLLSNALKFTKNDTVVEIKYHFDKEKKQHCFRVCDQGDGLDVTNIKSLFEPFYQGDNSRENVISGTGLGLAISKRIINEIHQGKIWAENNTHGGACFHVTLPANLV